MVRVSITICIIQWTCSDFVKFLTPSDSWYHVLIFEIFDQKFAQENYLRNLSHLNDLLLSCKNVIFIETELVSFV